MFRSLLAAEVWAVWAVASPYSLSYEANAPEEFPESAGFERFIRGGGATRTVTGGIFTLLSHQNNVSDSYRFDGRKNMNPGQGELFVAQWRMRLIPGSGDGDVQVYIAGDDYGGAADLAWGEESLWVVYQASIPLVATDFHVYRLVSSDMQTFRLYVDGLFVFRGRFQLTGAGSSLVMWGDPAISVPFPATSSSSQWDYFRVDVTSLPFTPVAALALVITLVFISEMLYEAKAPRRVRRSCHYLTLALSRDVGQAPQAFWGAVAGLRTFLRVSVLIQVLLVLWLLVGFILFEWRSQAKAPYAGPALAVGLGVLALVSVVLRWLPSTVYWRLRRLLRIHDFAVCPRCAHVLDAPPSENLCPDCGTPYVAHEVRENWQGWLAG